MLQSKSFVKKTKKGKVLKVVREHYLRDDIYSGSPLDPECDPSSHKLSAEAPHYLIVDTNIALHQMDLLEHPAITDAIITSVVLEEVKARNTSAYQRLRALISSDLKRFYVFANEYHRDTYITADPGESPNDRNDRAIRVAAAWYVNKIPSMKILLLSDDAHNRTKAKELGVTAVSSHEYAAMRHKDAPDLIDLVAANKQADIEMLDKDSNITSSSSKQKKQKQGQKIYQPHLSISDIMMGLKSGRFHQGSLRVSRFMPYDGWVSSDSIGKDILIKGRVSMNRAMDGDVVAIEILPEDQWHSMVSTGSIPGRDTSKIADTDDINDDNEDGEHIGRDSEVHLAPEIDVDASNVDPQSNGEAARRPTGKVVGIVKRNWRSRGYCGSLKPPKNDGTSSSFSDGSHVSVLFIPVEQRFPPIRISTRQAGTLADKRFIVVVDGWEEDSYHPLGHYVRTLGCIGDVNVETEVLLIENDVRTSPFSPAVHACVPPLPWTVTDRDIADPAREDLRHIAVCSVDPPGCKDIDDALHLRELPNGNYELGVHIADVSHFVKPGTAMDSEAATRATTTYLVQRRIDMLPKPLTEDICSLRSGMERLAFSVIWEITPDALVLNTRFTKSVICSRAALTYQEAQARIDDQRLHDEVTVSLRAMNRVAKIMRQRRMERGALQLASPEVKFEIDRETLDPLDVGMYQVRETNQMVEEMMLLANCSVAEHCLKHFPATSLLRRHPTPAQQQFEPLLRAAAAVNVSIDTTTSKSLAESLDEAIRASDPYFNKLIRIMATRCMTQAVYCTSNEVSLPDCHHYGLAAPLYTHFTSPIRRYADVVVHRVLMATLGLEALPDTMLSRDIMHDVVGNLNLRHRNAQLAGRASVELHTLIFFKEKKVIADARVVGIRANKLIVFVPKFGIEGPVYLDDEDVVDGGMSMFTSARCKGDTPSSRKDGNDGSPLYVFDEEKQVIKDATSGTIQYTIFDPCAVQIYVEEGVARRRTLVLKMISRQLLPESEKMNA